MPIACAVALVLLLDASGSVSSEDWRMQADGTAEAIADDAVVRIIERQGSVAMTAIAFSDITRPLVPWRIVSGAAEAHAFAQALREAPRVLYGGTRIGEAITDALAAFDEAPCQAEQEVVDISSDGDADPGPTARARDAAAERGVRVNAIGIGRHPGGNGAGGGAALDVPGGGAAVDVPGGGAAVNAPGGSAAGGGAAVNAPGTPADWLRENAITVGGFALSANDWGDFARAMRRKLAMELAAR